MAAMRSSLLLAAFHAFLRKDAEVSARIIAQSGAKAN